MKHFSPVLRYNKWQGVFDIQEVKFLCAVVKDL